MEPNDLKPHSTEDAALEAWLRAAAPAESLPDDGFSRRVLAALPPPARRRSARGLTCLAGALAGIAVVLTRPPGPEELPDWPQILTALSDPRLGVAITAALAVTALSLWLAFRDRSRRTL